MNLCADCTEIEFNIHFTIAAKVNVYNFPFAFYYFTEKHLMDWTVVSPRAAADMRLLVYFISRTQREYFPPELHPYEY